MSKQTHKPSPIPSEEETQFFRHPVRATRYHSKKRWFKIAASTLLLAILGGIGTWIGSAAMDWFKDHHCITTAEQQMIHSNYWQGVALRRDINNLQEAVRSLENPPGTVAQKSTNSQLTALSQ